MVSIKQTGIVTSVQIPDLSKLDHATINSVSLKSVDEIQ